MTNLQVAKAFIKGKAAKATNLSTDGETVVSYGWYQIAKRKCFEGVCNIILRAGKMYSTTTAKQRSTITRAAIVEGEADSLFNAPTETPKIQAEMNIDGELE